MATTTYHSALLQTKSYRVLRLFVTKILSDFNLSVAEWSILGLLYQHGSMQASVLANLLDVEAPFVTTVIDSLENKRYAKRTAAKDDRRAKLVTITIIGKNLVPDIEKAVSQKLRVALRSISDVQLETYMQVLQLIIEALPNT